MDYNINLSEDALMSSPTMKEIYKKADLLAQNKASVLIYGESGTGKNHLAEYIQRRGSSPRSPFIHVFCNAVSDQLFASELFGYTPGAFTGASPKGKTGLLESAQNGTILFDEINELSAENQALLLHFLQNKTITPIGSLKSREIHTRIISISGQNLLDMIQEGTFRADLYYRICVASICIPPLRERREEIPLFFSHFIRQFEKEYGCAGREHRISGEQMQKLCALNWTGNLWEVENLALRICLSDQPEAVIEDYLKTEQHFALFSPSPHAQAGQQKNVKLLKEALRDFEKSYIENVVSHSGSLQKAALQLGISYSSLCRKRAEYGLVRPKHVSSMGQRVP